MNINCIICSDQIIATSEIYSTQCGHLFHYTCLIQWIERSRSCPQCRQRSTEKTIHRIYFNVANTENIVDDVVTLQLKLDSAHFELKLKDKDIQNHTNRLQTAKSQNSELRKEIAKLEQSAHTLQQANSQLRDQLQFYKHKSKDNQKLNEIIVDLKQQIKNYESIQLIINGTREDCNALLKETNDIESLKLLIITLKKALVDTENKKLRYEHRYRHLQNEFNQLKKDRTNQDQELLDIKQKYDQYEKNWQLEKLEMRKLIEQLNIDKDDSLANRVIVESPIPLQAIKLRRLRSEMRVDTPITSNNNIINNNNNNNIINNNNGTDSPYLQVKSTAYNYFLNHPIKKRSLPDRLKIDNQSVDYDGLGGHGKVDEFPKSSPPIKSLTLKRRVATSGSVSAKFRKLAPITKT